MLIQTWRFFFIGTYNRPVLVLAREPFCSKVGKSINCLRANIKNYRMPRHNIIQKCTLIKNMKITIS